MNACTCVCEVGEQRGEGGDCVSVVCVCVCTRMCVSVPVSASLYVHVRFAMYM